jgi:hypothetical protein
VSLKKSRRPIASPETGLLYRDVTITTAQLLALNATPQAVVPAPGAGKYLEFCGAEIYMPYNSAAYNGIASGEDLSIKYTDGSGVEVGQCETTGFLDQTSSQRRFVRPTTAASGNTAIVPAANAALVICLLVGEIATGDSPLKVRTFYRVHTAVA